MKQTIVTWSDVEHLTHAIIHQTRMDEWRPDYVVGITRGGLLPANLLSQYFGCPMHTLQVQLRDGGESESNLWMAEDAFGYEMGQPRRILIVDDINDTGATLNWIREDWRASCLPDDPRWDSVWGYNVRVACLYENSASHTRVPVTYSGVTINKLEDPQWIVFPWEEWWLR